jgi:hypothetical protein
LKLAPLLTQFLSINKRLDLPGIGSFLLDPSITNEPENHKHSRPANLSGVSFESNPLIKESAELIQFIAAETGKMKALAASDLDSHLELAQQFLNIGKPFLFEGIGSLVKVRSGQFVFASGQVMPDRMKDYSAREISSTSTTEDSFTNYKDVFSPGSGITKWRKPVVFFLTMAGIAFAIWAGYTVYKTTTAKKESPLSEQPTQEPVPPVTDSTQVHKADSTTSVKKDSIVIPIQNTALGKYKFVIEIANHRRAAERYAKLKSYQWNIQMETKDSSVYKLFLLLPIAATDTTRVLDSLTVLSGKKVYIEN